MQLRTRVYLRCQGRSFISPPLVYQERLKDKQRDWPPSCSSTRLCFAFLRSRLFFRERSVCVTKAATPSPYQVSQGDPAPPFLSFTLEAAKLIPQVIKYIRISQHKRPIDETRRVLSS